MLHCMMETIHRYAMVQPGDTVTVALSGGADSTALLLGLLALREQLGISLRAVHVNHHLRGTESDRDAAFCAQLCEERQVPFFLGTCDVATYAAQRKHTSCEMAARELRYAQLEALCPPGSKIATAHTASDNTETVLERLTRGTGLAGLCGIPPVRGRIIRPLLYVTRPQILGFLAQQHQSYVTDSTNAQDAFFRNRLRHHVLPVLRQQNPAVDRMVGAMTRILSDEQQYLEQQAQDAFDRCFDQAQNSLSGLQNLHPAMERRVLALFLQRCGVEVSAVRIARVEQLLQTGGKQNIAAGVYLTADQGMLKWEHAQAPSPAVGEMVLQIGENRLMPGRLCMARLEKINQVTSDCNIHSKFTNATLDYDRIKGTAVLRGRKQGDSIRLAGRDFTKSVKKLLQEKVPVQQRSKLHYLQDDAGLIWIEGIGISARVQPDAGTQQLLTLTVSDG